MFQLDGSDCCRTVSCPRYSMFVMRTFPSTCPINSNPFSLWQQLVVISTAMRTPELWWLMHASQLQTLPSWRDTPLHWPLSLSHTPRLWPSTTAMTFLLVSVPTPINLQDESMLTMHQDTNPSFATAWTAHTNYWINARLHWRAITTLKNLTQMDG